MLCLDRSAADHDSETPWGGGFISPHLCVLSLLKQIRDIHLFVVNVGLHSI